jgi:hypothetical protein
MSTLIIARACSLLMLPLLTTSSGRFGMGARYAPVRMLAAPRKKGVDSYQTVSVACQKCDTLLFRYKKKNGLKSNLIKCYIERIVQDEHGLLKPRQQPSTEGASQPCSSQSNELHCPTCQSRFARDALIHGRPALKMVGGKVRMWK